MKIISIIQDIIDNVKDDTGRTQRQWLAVKRWAKSLFHGTFVACTGFGKTMVGFMAIKLLRRTNPDRKVIVVVPKRSVRDQWNGWLKKSGNDKNTEVWVINSLSSQEEVQECTLLICDEIHWYAAETFKRVFQVVNYKYILGLTATIERSDGKHALLQKYAPVVDEVPLHVARQKGWVAEYDAYAYGITLPESEQQEYEQYYGKDSKLTKYMPVFDYDIQTIIRCSAGNKPRFNKVTRQMMDSPPVRIARKMGWNGNSAHRALLTLRENKTLPRGQKKNIWGGDLDHPYHPDRIVGYAVQTRKIIAARKEYISNHPLKTEAVIEIYNLLNRKTIAFSETKKVAHELYSRIGEDRAVKYYTGMSAIPIEVEKTKEYKTRRGVDNFIKKHPDRKFEVKEKNGKFILSWRKEKLVGEKFQKEEALRKLRDNRYNIDFIASVKALNEGIDIPDLALALIHSVNSVSRDIIQRIGRVARLFVYKDGSEKKPIIVIIYLKNTKDEAWLKRALRKVVGVKWIDSISNIVTEENFFEIVA